MEGWSNGLEKWIMLKCLAGGVLQHLGCMVPLPDLVPRRPFSAFIVLQRPAFAGFGVD